MQFIVKVWIKITIILSIKFPKINSKIPIYDFSDYNSITDGLSENKQFVNGYYLDFGHYSKEVGE